MILRNPLHSAVQSLFKAEALTLIAGPCVIESVSMCLEIAQAMQAITEARNIPYIFKASFDKANRTSLDSYRGPGIEEGLAILTEVRNRTGIPVLTDIHEPHQAPLAAEHVDVLQIPAFLCRQTDLIKAAAKTGRPTCIKKAQHLDPNQMHHAVTKFRLSGGTHIALTERGTALGYGNLVVDMRSLERMRQTAQTPIVFDATHSVQQPGGMGAQTGGEREFAPLLARAAAAVGIDGLFCEVHPQPDQALSDGANSLNFEQLAETLDQVLAIDKTLRTLRQSTNKERSSEEGPC